MNKTLSLATIALVAVVMGMSIVVPAMAHDVTQPKKHPGSKKGENNRPQPDAPFIGYTSQRSEKADNQSQHRSLVIVRPVQMT